jgi:hypothetical protein
MLCTQHVSLICECAGDSGEGLDYTKLCRCVLIPNSKLGVGIQQAMACVSRAIEGNGMVASVLAITKEFCMFKECQSSQTSSARPLFTIPVLGKICEHL